MRMAKALPPWRSAGRWRTLSSSKNHAHFHSMAAPVALPTLPLKGDPIHATRQSSDDEEKNTTSPGSASIASKHESFTSSTWLAPSVFDDEATAKLYEPPANYEGAHRFDIKARWTKEEVSSARRNFLACAVELIAHTSRHDRTQL